MRPAPPDADATADDGPYVLAEQVGFILRQVVQRHAALFADGMNNAVTATQWAALATLSEQGPLSQNLLGRGIVMDAATAKGVVDRLSARGLVRTGPDPGDRRRHVVDLTASGRETVARLTSSAAAITTETLAPLTARERAQLLRLLRKLC